MTHTETPISQQTPAQTVDALNSLLRGELSAVETYERALESFRDHPAANVKLRTIRNEHAEAVRVLKDRVRHYGGTPAEGSGAWGALAGAVTGTAKAIGPATTLSALQRGEEVGITDYRKALDGGVPPDCRDAILNDLMPRCEEHIAYLDDLQKTIA